LITDIPLSGSLGLVIKNNLTNSRINSISLKLDLFQGSGHYWLPLFKDQMNDFISTLPTDKNSPKVLIQIIR
jgi:hypothetical protein